MIKMADMLKLIRQTDGSGKFRPVSLVFSTASLKRKTGGTIRELHRARLLSPRRSDGDTLNFMPVGTKEIVAVHPDLILYVTQQEVV